jgi:hypothetical protein
MSETERDSKFSVRRLLGKHGTLTEEDERDDRAISDLLADKLLLLPKLLPDRRVVHESSQLREHVVLSYKQQEEIVWSFAHHIEEVYEAAGRIGIKRCPRYTDFVRFSDSVVNSLAAISAKAWFKSTADFAILPQADYDGKTKMFDEFVLKEIVISNLEPTRQALQVAALAFSQRAEHPATQPHRLNQAPQREPSPVPQNSSVTPTLRKRSQKSATTSREEKLNYSDLKRLEKLHGQALARAKRRRKVVLPKMRKIDLTVYKLAKDSDLDRNAIQEFLDGKTKEMSEFNRKRVADVLGLSPEKLPK